MQHIDGGAHLRENKQCFKNHISVVRSWSELRLVISFSPVLGSGVPLHQITLLMLFLNWWFRRAYTNGLTAELNNTIISTATIWTKLISRVVRVLNAYSTDSAPQETAKMKLTAIAIKVTRFRTFMTPCELREGKGSQSVKVADDEVKYAVKSVIREATRLH